MRYTGMVCFSRGARGPTRAAAGAAGAAAAAAPAAAAVLAAAAAAADIESAMPARRGCARDRGGNQGNTENSTHVRAQKSTAFNVRSVTCEGMYFVGLDLSN